MPNKTYPLGVPEIKRDRRNIMLASLAMPTVSLPRKFSLKNKQSAVAYQNYGSCTGFTLKDLLEATQLKNQSFYKDLSGRFAYAMEKKNDNYGCDGGSTPQNMMQIAVGIGVCEEGYYPNDPQSDACAYIANVPQQAIDNAKNYVLTGYIEINGLESIKQMLFQTNIPIPITIAVYDDYLSVDPQSGLVKQPTGAFIGMHEISAIGWDDDLQGLEFKNHWGTNWGLAGYGIMPYIYNNQPGFVGSAFSASDMVDATKTTGAPVDLQYPVKMPVKITQPFGSNFNDSDGKSHYAKYGLAGHEGIDFHAAVGDPCFAIDSGKIIFAGNDGDAYGQTIKIQHSWGVSLYAHLSELIGYIGQTVSKGMVIAKTGDSGDAKVGGAHLHLGGTINGVKNPSFKDWVDLSMYFTKGDRMLVFFQVKNTKTIWSLQDGEWVGFSDPTAFNNYVDSRPNSVIALDQAEFDKLKANPDVYKT